MTKISEHIYFYLKNNTMNKLIYLFLILSSFGLYAQTDTDYMEKGMEKTMLKDFSGAIADSTKAIELNPNRGGYFYNRGLSKYYLGDKNGACQDARQAQQPGVNASPLIEGACLLY